MPEEEAELRLRILEYVDRNETPHFFQIVKDLNLHSDTIAKELKTLIDQGFLVAYEGGYYSLTQEGVAEMNQLRGGRK